MNDLKKEPVKLNATQKIEALENTLLGYEKKFEILADEIDQVREIARKLERKLNASIKAGEDGKFGNDAISKIIVEENTKELDGKVKFLVSQGVLTLDNEKVIDAQTFIVAREMDKDGVVVNPRLQFAMMSIPEDSQGTFVGKKVGDVVTPKDSEVDIEITEVYVITPPSKNLQFDNEPEKETTPEEPKQEAPVEKIETPKEEKPEEPKEEKPEEPKEEKPAEKVEAPQEMRSGFAKIGE